jgi:hypothetical protein
MWLVAYEVTKKGWWQRAKDSNYIESHAFFGELWKREIEFYEPQRKARPRTWVPFLMRATGVSLDAASGGYPE